MGRSRTRNTLITCEVALSLVLLIGAGLLVRSYTRVLRADPGFDPQERIVIPPVAAAIEVHHAGSR